MLKKKSAAKAVAASALALGLVLAVAQPASAIVITPQCASVLYSSAGYQSGTQPNTTVWCQIQAGPANDPSNAANGGFVYNYQANGVPGVNTWKGLQSYLRNWGYTGSISGTPNAATYNAMIRAGNHIAPYGVQPLDGSLSVNDWRNFAYHVKIAYWGM